MRKRNINLGTKIQDDVVVEEDGTENFMQFVSRLNQDTGILDEGVDNERTYYGFNVDFDGFNVSFKKDENSAVNNIAVDGNLDLMIKTIKNITFNLSGTTRERASRTPTAGWRSTPATPVSWPPRGAARAGSSRGCARTFWPAGPKAAS